MLVLLGADPPISGEELELVISPPISYRTYDVRADPAANPETGAGDSFAGGLLGYLAGRAETSPAAMRKAMFFAATLGSFCVEGIGPARLLTLSRSELKARIAAFARLVDHGGALVTPST